MAKAELLKTNLVTPIAPRGVSRGVSVGGVRKEQSSTFQQIPAKVRMFLKWPLIHSKWLGDSIKGLQKCAFPFIQTLTACE